MYANANKAPGQVEDKPAEPKGTYNQLTIKHDFSGLTSSMYAAYKYGQAEDDLGKKIWGIPDNRTNMGGIPGGGDNMGGIHDIYNPDDVSQNGSNMEGLYDMSNLDDQSQTTAPPDLEDVSTPPDGALGASRAPGPTLGDPSLIFREATEAEQKQRQDTIDRQAELFRSSEEKQRLADEERQQQQDKHDIEAKPKQEEDELQKRAADAIMEMKLKQRAEKQERENAEAKRSKKATNSRTMVNKS